jgi:hypothetical protein
LSQQEATEEELGLLMLGLKRYDKKEVVWWKILHLII